MSPRLLTAGLVLLALVAAHADRLAAQAASGAARPPAASAPAASTKPAATSTPATKGAAGKEDRTPENQPTMRDDKDVIEASEKWLRLIDGARYGAAWDLATKTLKAAAPRKTFVDGVAEARKPFGKLVERTPAQFARSHSLPGGPDGDYALVSFETRFASGKTADEQVVWFLEPDAVWRVSGYYIR